MIAEETLDNTLNEKRLHTSISVDCVIFGFDFENLNVLLVERKLEDPVTKKPVISDYTLTGNHVFVNEELEDAASRVLFNLTGLKDIYLEQFATFASPDRLIREKDKLWRDTMKLTEKRVVSVGYYSLVDCNKVNIVEKDRKVIWHPVDKKIDLAFDHQEILDKALVVLRDKLRNEPVGFELLPRKFTLSQLQRLYEVIFDAELDKRNFRKKISKLKYFEPLNEKQKGVAHKPARFYSFNKKAYEKAKRNLLNFNI